MAWMVFDVTASSIYRFVLSPDCLRPIDLHFHIPDRSITRTLITTQRSATTTTTRFTVTILPINGTILIPSYGHSMFETIVNPMSSNVIWPNEPIDGRETFKVICWRVNYSWCWKRTIRKSRRKENRQWIRYFLDPIIWTVFEMYWHSVSTIWQRMVWMTYDSMNF